MSDNIYFWDNFKTHPQGVQDELLAELELLLPNMTWKEQASTFQGAPAEVTLKYLKSLAWEAQVRIWKEFLPVSARPDAEKLLCREARIVLRLNKRSRVLA